MKIKTVAEFNNIEAEGYEQNYFCDIPEEVYHAISPMGHSRLCGYKESPAHYKASLTKVFKPSAAMTLGSAIHCMILEPHLFTRQYAIMPRTFKDKRAKGYKDWYDNFGVGKVVIDEATHAKVVNATSSVLTHPDIYDYFASGVSEHVGIATDTETGIRMKIRMDKYHPEQKVIVDLKTTSKNIASKQYLNSIAEYNYIVQAAYYSDVAEIIDGDEHQYLLIAVETEPPFSVIMYMMDHGTIQLGRRTYRKYLDKHKECLDSGKYPGYDNVIREYSAPKWAYDS